MRWSLIVFVLLFSAVALISCDDESTESPVQRVAIEGKQHPVVKIGNQFWTASNYEGPGGVTYDASNTRPEYGKIK